MADQPDKGGRTEELLRDYFMKAGYFAVRGVPFIYDGLEVTDIDVWLYLRPSPLGRERVIVDAKDRRRPNALERVLWAKGLQNILGVERAVVATTDKRSSLKSFGEKHRVLVLDGHFIARLAVANGTQDDRLSEEEFVTQLVSGRDDKLLGQWRARFERAKSRLVTTLEFDGCNGWLEETRYFVDQMLTSSRPEAACRLVYVLVSYFLVGLDYSLRTLAFEPPDVRKTAIEDGLRHGSEGKAGIERPLTLAMSLIEGYVPEARGLGAQLRERVTRELSQMPVDILGEFFTRQDSHRELFALARAFESRAYARAFTPPARLEVPMQSVILVLLDFFAIDRSRLFAVIE